MAAKLGTLVFSDEAEIRTLIAHATAAPRHLVTFDERHRIYGEDKCGTPQPDEDTKVTAALWLIKDQGVYLMSNGVPRDTVGTGSRIVYAKGFDPRAVEFDDWWDRARQLLGGDDFVQRLEIEQIEAQLARTGTLKIGVTAKAFTY